jgi:hypothetical protein
MLIGHLPFWQQAHFPSFIMSLQQQVMAFPPCACAIGMEEAQPERTITINANRSGANPRIMGCFIVNIL